jgi:periplasmic glucans biosynthesis protein
MLYASTALTEGARAQTAAPAGDAAAPTPDSAPATPAPVPVSQPFSFEALTEEMRALAAAQYKTPEEVKSFLDSVNYDDYRLITFNPDQARWAAAQSVAGAIHSASDPRPSFILHAFPMGWLFKVPVRLFEVIGGNATEMVFTSDDFKFLNGLEDRLPPEAKHAAMPGVSGFRLHTPLNRPDVMDELIAFQGASYFRALGRGNAYGLSARGLAINTGMSVAEEFPTFTKFYLERPEPGAMSITLYAALDSASVTGAYRFVITPGADTMVEVTARLFFRADVEQLGVAPLTSMFLFSEKNRDKFDDYRPNVHDSDGLRILRADGDLLWRPLNNPPRLAGSYLGESSPRRFGLHQRDRDFDNYQDSAAHYEKRPSVDVEPIGDWGQGSVRLVEIPTDLEVNDNIVAFWVPADKARAGDSREFAYKLHWGNLPHDDMDPRAQVYETRAGTGGVSGVENTDGTRKFVIDYKGGLIAALGGNVVEAGDLEAVTTVSGGEIVTSTLSKIDGTDVWRLVLDVKGPEGGVVELGAHLRGYGKKLSETWLYQWIVA